MTINPYTRLLNRIKSFCFKLRTRRTVYMWNYPKNRLNEGWTLGDLYERAQAADQLGYDVIVETSPGSGITLKYVERLPAIPLDWQ